jgi:hypothetical protein
MAKRNVTYPGLPTVGQWKSDSDDGATAREDDSALIRIDELLANIQHTPPGASSLGPALIDLFLDVNDWLERRRGQAGHAGRWEAVRALREAALTRLSPMIVDARDPEPFEAALARAMRTMNELGAAVGDGFDPFGAGYRFSQEKTLNHRLVFRGGLAFQIPWWRERQGGESPLACSERIAGERGERREFLAPTEKASPFIVLANQQIFLTRRHRAPADSFSSAAAPDAAHRIVMAGMLLIVDGRLEALRLDSGDFHAETDELRGFLTYLKHHGVDLRTLRLVDCGRDRIAGVSVSADRFLRSGSEWAHFAMPILAPALPAEPSSLEAASRDVFGPWIASSLRTSH